MKVEKANGELESFKLSKLSHSLRRAGASPKEVKRICGIIEKELYNGIKTSTIYRRAFRLLRESEEPFAARYSLRRALFSLGPTGFPFEDFLARLLEAEGYHTQTRQTLTGRCATHEVDVVAHKGKMCVLVEAKFHGRPGVKSDLQVLLYSYARFLDLKDTKLHKSAACNTKESVIATNTKFTRSAVAYAECVGLTLLSWNYPKENSLQERVERVRLFPITVLTSLSKGQKQELLVRGVILCRELVDKRNILRSIGVSSRKVELVIKEANRLCSQ